jgi:hypothetical protein
MTTCLVGKPPQGARQPPGVGSYDQVVQVRRWVAALGGVESESLGLGLARAGRGAAPVGLAGARTLGPVAAVDSLWRTIRGGVRRPAGGRADRHRH